MSSDLPATQSFGNYAVHGIAEIHLPDPVPWTPTAPGWMIVWVILVLIGFWALYRLFLKWRQNAYRRCALKILEKLRQNDVMTQKSGLCALPRLLKQTALNAYPRTRVASLSGEKWIAFLESRYSDPGFKGDAGKHLMVVSYQDPKSWAITQEQAAALFSLAKRWIQHHRPEGES